MVGASIPGEHHQPGSLHGIPRAERFGAWSMADLCFLAMTGKKPTDEEALPLQILIGLLISNGPGAISAQEGMAFLLEQFRGTGLKDPTDSAHGLDLKAMARDFAARYRQEKRAAKELGREIRALPGVHHSVFKGKPVNHDPRERFIAEYLTRHSRYNVFHAFYRELVQALYDAGASPYVFCVNVDAVIAALLLALLWDDFTAGRLCERDLETAAFTVSSMAG